MTPTVLDAETFDDFVSNNEVAVVGFIGEGGMDAAGFSAAAGQAMATHSGAAFATVGSDSSGLFSMFGLKGSATAIFRERIVVYLEPGIPPAEHMKLLLDRVTALDMAQAHAEIEQERAARAALATHNVCPTARRGKFPS
ncbi:MAG TPA: hypothetical protein VIU02_11970 [Burkholderiales bacterium]